MWLRKLQKIGANYNMIGDGSGQCDLKDIMLDCVLKFVWVFIPNLRAKAPGIIIGCNKTILSNDHKTNIHYSKQKIGAPSDSSPVSTAGHHQGASSHMLPDTHGFVLK